MLFLTLFIPFTSISWALIFHQLFSLDFLRGFFCSFPLPSYITTALFFFFFSITIFPAPSFRLAIRFTRAPRPARPMLASQLLAIFDVLVLIPQPIFFLFNVVQYIYSYCYVHLIILCVLTYFILRQLWFGLHIADTKLEKKSELEKWLLWFKV